MMRCSDSNSQAFSVKNGVWQSEIVLLIFFNIYLDDLSFLLNDSGTECMINECLINHLFYADDCALLAPSPRAIQKLSHICNMYANDCELTFNAKKTKVMYLKPKGMSNLHVPVFT